MYELLVLHNISNRRSHQLIRRLHSQSAHQGIIALSQIAIAEYSRQLLVFREGDVNRFVKLNAPARVRIQLHESAISLLAFPD
jgi:hypothetical protein